MSIGINLTLAWRLKPQLHKQNLDFSLVRAGGLGFCRRDFNRQGLN